MKKLSVFTFSVLCCVLGLVSCNSTSNDQSDKKGVFIPNIHTEVKGSQRSFVYDVFDDYSIEVRIEGSGSINKSIITASKSGEVLAVDSVETDPVISIYYGDYNRDKSPNIVLITQSAGSGSYKNAVGFEFKQDSFIGLKPLQLPFSAKDTYMGHDSLWIKNNMIYRKFPVYQKDDSNVRPTGGERTIQYTLEKDYAWKEVVK
ncbi:MAG: hypothetical protein ACEPOW_08380 [Bacteroidales bacterium]